jgi:hypothetical protein
VKIVFRDPKGSREPTKGARSRRCSAPDVRERPRAQALPLAEVSQAEEAQELDEPEKLLRCCMSYASASHRITRSPRQVRHNVASNLFVLGGDPVVLPGDGPVMPFAHKSIMPAIAQSLPRVDAGIMGGGGTKRMAQSTKKTASTKKHAPPTIDVYEEVPGSGKVERRPLARIELPPSGLIPIRGETLDLESLPPQVVPHGVQGRNGPRVKVLSHELAWSKPTEEGGAHAWRALRLIVERLPTGPADSGLGSTPNPLPAR